MTNNYTNSFTDLNQALVMAQETYKQKVEELQKAIEQKEIVDIEQIKAESTIKRIRLEVSLNKTNLDHLMEISRNLRRESSII